MLSGNLKEAMVSMYRPDVFNTSSVFKCPRTLGVGIRILEDVPSAMFDIGGQRHSVRAVPRGTYSLVDFSPRVF